MSALNQYWYNAILNRNGVCINRMGTMEAEYALKVIDSVKGENPTTPVMEISVHRMSEAGEVGDCVLKESGGRRTYNPYIQSHTCETPARPVVRPYDFGTACTSATYRTFNFEDIKDGKDSMPTQPRG